MSLRFHEIVEGEHRILNPFSPEKLELLGELCRLRPGLAQLDVACGKGELLCQWADRHGIEGVGVDLSAHFLEAARARADELGLVDRLSFSESDGAEFLKGNERLFDVVSCIGATWIGGGLDGTLLLMRRALRDPTSLLLVGEPFFNESPPPEAAEALTDTEQGFTSLEGTLDRFEAAGFELLEMLVANLDDWDRYEASQWITGSEWLRAHPDDADHDKLAAWIAANRRSYLRYGRRYLGWGVFVLRALSG